MAWVAWEQATSEVAGRKLTTYARGTNGLVYQQFIAPMPDLNEDELALLPLYNQALTEVGIGDSDYLAVQQRQAAEVGAFNAFSALRGALDNEQDISGYATLSAKALARNATAQNRLLVETLEKPRFDELDQ